MVKPTYRCNASCRYCSSWRHDPPPDMDVSTLLALLDRVFAAADSRKIGQLTLLWTGGEPTLWGHAAFRAVFEHVASCSHIPIRHLMQSNLIGLDRAWVELLRAFDVGLSTSVDPVDARLRVFDNGSPQYAKWCAAFMRAVDAGLSVGLIFTAVSDHLGQEERIYNFFRSLRSLAGREIAVRVNPLYASGRAARADAHVGLDAAGYARILLRFAELWEADGRLLRLSPLDEWAGRSRRSCEFSGSCARRFLAVDGSYRLAHCARYLDVGRYLSAQEPDPVGAALDHPQTLRLAGRQGHLRSSECRDCRFWDRCRGGCPFVAELATGDPLARNPFCESYRAVLALLEVEHAAVS